MADRKVENLSPLKAEELRDCADTSVDLASGLGQKVYVAGLSAGGTLAAWIAQNRGQVTRAVLIALALGLTRHEGTRLQKALALLLPFLPDVRTTGSAWTRIALALLPWFFVQGDGPTIARQPGHLCRRP